MNGENSLISNAAKLDKLRMSLWRRRKKNNIKKNILAAKLVVKPIAAENDVLIIFYDIIFPFFFQTETALVYDAVQMFAKALTDLDRSQEVETTSIDCGGRETWQHGNSLVNYMKMVWKVCMAKT